MKEIIKDTVLYEVCLNHYDTIEDFAESNDINGFVVFNEVYSYTAKLQCKLSNIDMLFYIVEPRSTARYLCGLINNKIYPLYTLRSSVDKLEVADKVADLIPKYIKINFQNQCEEYKTGFNINFSEAELKENRIKRDLKELSGYFYINCLTSKRINILNAGIEYGILEDNCNVEQIAQKLSLDTELIKNTFIGSINERFNDTMLDIARYYYYWKDSYTPDMIKDREVLQTKINKRKYAHIKKLLNKKVRIITTKESVTGTINEILFHLDEPVLSLSNTRNEYVFLLKDINKITECI